MAVARAEWNASAQTATLGELWRRTKRHVPQTLIADTVAKGYDFRCNSAFEKKELDLTTTLMVWCLDSFVKTIGHVFITYSFLSVKLEIMLHFRFFYNNLLRNSVHLKNVYLRVFTGHSFDWVQTSFESYAIDPLLEISAINSKCWFSFNVTRPANWHLIFLWVCWYLLVFADGYQQNHNSRALTEKVKRPTVDRSRTQVSGRSLLAPLLLTSESSPQLFESNSFSSGSKATSDHSRGGVIQPVGEQAVVQCASGLLKIRCAAGTTAIKLPRLQYSGPATVSVRGVNTYIPLYNANHEIRSRTFIGKEVNERVRSLTSLDQFPHVSSDQFPRTRRTLQMSTTNTREPIQTHKETHFKWSELAKHTWDCWYGEDVTSTVQPVQCSYSNSNILLTRKGPRTLGLDHERSDQMEGKRVGHNSNRHFNPQQPINQLPYQIPRAIEKRESTLKQNAELRFERQSSGKIPNYPRLLEITGFTDPLTASPPFIRMRLTEMEALVAHSVFIEVFHETHFRKRVKKSFRINKIRQKERQSAFSEE